MKISVFDEPSSVDEAEFLSDIEKLPLWRRNQAMKYRFLIDRVLCSRSYLMLMCLIRETCGTIEDNITFEYGEYGKPSIREHPEIQFNLAHCRKGIICAVDSYPTGCDIEEIPVSIDMDLCRSCFNEGELSLIVNSAEPCVEFTKLWTIKEAYLKLYGLGLGENLQSLFTPEILKTVNITSTVCKERGYVYSVATEAR